MESKEVKEVTLSDIVRAATIVESISPPAESVVTMVKPVRGTPEYGF